MTFVTIGQLAALTQVKPPGDNVSGLPCLFHIRDKAARAHCKRPDAEPIGTSSTCERQSHSVFSLPSTWLRIPGQPVVAC